MSVFESAFEGEWHHDHVPNHEKVVIWRLNGCLTGLQRADFA